MCGQTASSLGVKGTFIIGAQQEDIALVARGRRAKDRKKLLFR